MATNSSQSNIQRPQAGNNAVRFCSYCGNKLDIGARFCKNCGEAVKQPVTSSENNNTVRLEHESEPYKPDGKSSYCSQKDAAANETNTERRTFFAGEIHKCPNCGEVIESFVVNCPACGYELRNTFVSKSIHNFTQRLERAATDEQRVLLIRNFPIANNKEDIFEFMILASTNIKGEQPASEFDAWVVKFEQSYQKAKLTFGDDPDFEDIEIIYIAIAIRLLTEQFMQRVITTNGQNCVDANSNQTREWYKQAAPFLTSDQKAIIEEVNLITPESIHLNSFMFEPLIDISDWTLKELFAKVSEL